MIQMEKNYIEFYFIIIYKNASVWFIFLLEQSLLDSFILSRAVYTCN